MGPPPAPRRRYDRARPRRPAHHGGGHPRPARRHDGSTSSPRHPGPRSGRRRIQAPPPTRRRSSAGWGRVTRQAGRHAALIGHARSLPTLHTRCSRWACQVGDQHEAVLGHRQARALTAGCGVALGRTQTYTLRDLRHRVNDVHRVPNERRIRNASFVITLPRLPNSALLDPDATRASKTISPHIGGEGR